MVTLTLLEFCLPTEDVDPPIKWAIKTRKDSPVRQIHDSFFAIRAWRPPLAHGPLGHNQLRRLPGNNEPFGPATDISSRFVLVVGAGS